MFEKITKGNSIYAVYNLSDDDEPDRTSMMMVNHSVGKKSGFAPVTFEEMNGHVTRMLFDITGKISLREYIGQNISQNDFRSMIVNIVDAIEQLDEYMIDIQQIKLDIDSVFINAFDHSISLVCIALKNRKSDESMYRFFRSVVENSYVTTQMNETSYFNRLWNIVRSDNNFSLSNIRTVLTNVDFADSTAQKQFTGGEFNINNDGRTETENESDVITIEPESKPEREIPEVPPVVQEEKKKGIFGIFQSRKKKADKETSFQDGLAKFSRGKSSSEEKNKADAVVSMDFGGTSVLNGGMVSEEKKIAPAVQDIPTEMVRPEPDVRDGTETVMLENDSSSTIFIGAEPEKRAFLVMNRTHERVQINQPVFTIGRDSENLGFSVNDNRHVGHRHAVIKKHDGAYYVTDLNSVNHTFLNGVQIQSGTEAQLSDNDILRCADEEFVFKLL